MVKTRGDTKTTDLFDVQELFPVHAPRTLPKALDFNRSVAMAMREAIKESGKTNDQVAAEMTELLAYEDDKEVTGAQLYAYTAASRETHTVSLVRFKAFVRATGCTWLWEIVLEGEGLTLLQGEEAKHAQASYARKMAGHYLAQAKQLEAEAPVEVRTPRKRK